MGFSNLTEEQIKEMLNMSEEGVTIRKAKFSELEPVEIKKGKKKDINILRDLDVEVDVEIGNTTLTLKEVLDLKKGSVIKLNKLAGDAVDIYVNKKWVAMGEVIIINDEFGVRVSSLLPEGNQKTQQE